MSSFSHRIFRTYKLRLFLTYDVYQDAAKLVTKNSVLMKTRTNFSFSLRRDMGYEITHKTRVSYVWVSLTRFFNDACQISLRLSLCLSFSYNFLSHWDENVMNVVCARVCIYKSRIFERSLNKEGGRGGERERERDLHDDCCLWRNRFFVKRRLVEREPVYMR